MTESLLEILRGRELPTTTTRYPRDPAGYMALVEEATAALRALKADGRNAEEQVARVAAAQAALDSAPTVEFTLTALAPAVWEELISAHPPTDALREQGFEWDPVALRPDLLSASVVPPGGQPQITADQWLELATAGAFGVGELDHLMMVAVQLNKRVVQVAPGKG